MEELKFNIYAEDINHNTFVKTYYNVSFVYLHGEFYNENNFDLVAITKEDGNDCDLHLADDVYIVNVVFPDGKEEKCYMYYWHNITKIEYRDFYVGDKVPFHNKYSIQHGLICRIGDNKANEDAINKFNKRINHL